MKYGKFLKGYLKTHKGLLIVTMLFCFCAGIALYALPSSIAYHQLVIIFVPIVSVVLAIFLGTKILYKQVNWDNVNDDCP